MMYQKAIIKLLTLLCMISACVACGPSQASLKALESQISQERSQIRGLRSAQKGIKAYHQHLKTGEGQSLMISKTALEASIRSMFSYTYKGKELDKKYLRGEISFVKVEGFELFPGNKARYWVHFDGRKIRAQNVPSIAKGTVNSLKKAVKAGRMLIEVVGSIDQKTQKLKLKSTPIAAQFKRENTSSNQSRFLDAARRKIFKKSKKIPLPAGLKNNTTVLTTPNHLVFIKNK
jgi:hypothetical protein